MLDKLKGAFGFLKFLGPILTQVPSILDMLGSILRVGVKAEDAQTVREACAEWAEASQAIRGLLDEADEVFLAVGVAVDEAGDGGKSITYGEIKTALDEVKDVGPAAAEATRQLTEVYGKLKNLV